MDFNRRPMTKGEALGWAAQHAKGKTPMAEVFKMVLAAAVYSVWRVRNPRVFKQQNQSTDVVTKLNIQEVHVKAGKWSIDLWIGWKSQLLSYLGQ